METPERVIHQAMPEMELGNSSDLFFKCPIGGFASLSPGVCPKCNELLVAVSGDESSAEGQSIFVNGNHSGRTSKR